MVKKQEIVAKKGRWVFAICGASGAKYALRLLDVLAETLEEVHLIISDAGLRVLHDEEGVKLSSNTSKISALIGREAPNVIFHNQSDIGATPASGSARFDGMVICPCSMGTLAAIANGLSTNLIQRAADVTLKERRPLVLVPRETPLSPIHLENMLKLSRIGVAIVAAMPGFYQRPKSISDLVDMQVMKVLDQMRIDNDLAKRWEGKESPRFERKLIVEELKVEKSDEGHFVSGGVQLHRKILGLRRDGED